MKKKTIGILNYGIGNILSVSNAFEKLDCKYELISNPNEIKNFEKIVLIGVGSFSACIDTLRIKNFLKNIKDFISADGYFLGICVGMQILMDFGTENKVTEGLGLIKGSVEKMSGSKNCPLPHIGWNEIDFISPNFKLFDDVQTKSSLYFLHSYKVNLKEQNLQIATVQYGTNKIVAALKKKNVFGVQFHPEKSQMIGMKIIKNFVNFI